MSCQSQIVEPADLEVRVYSLPDTIVFVDTINVIYLTLAPSGVSVVLNNETLDSFKDNILDRLRNSLALVCHDAMLRHSNDLSFVIDNKEILKLENGNVLKFNYDFKEPLWTDFASFYIVTYLEGKNLVVC